MLYGCRDWHHENCHLHLADKISCKYPPKYQTEPVLSDIHYTISAKDTRKCYEIIDIGRKFQQEQGFTQWTKEYPNFQTIQQDIASKKGFVIKIDQVIAGYMCIDFSGEPAYENIEGKWNSSEDYAVVHRMAFASEFLGNGLSDTVWKLIEKYCYKNKINYIRVDTDFSNKRMQHILEKNGFVKCGVIYFQGGGKIAYDKLVLCQDFAQIKMRNFRC